MSFPIALPPVPDARGYEGDEPGRAELLPRYEDITQDGRFLLPAMMPGLGLAVWRTLLMHLPALDAFREQGILPILRRLVMVADAAHAGPFSVHVPITYVGRWRLAREKGGARLFVNMWLDAHAPVAHTLGPPPPKDAPRVRIGGLFAEHVITKPFAKRPEERKVTRLDVPGFPDVPEDEHVYEPGEALLTLPVTPETDALFGMIHTDSNQHVNSLVYPRMYEEALVRRHRDPTRLSRALDMRWRKPFFTGERALIALGIADDKTHAVGTFSPENSPDRASCVIASSF